MYLTQAGQSENLTDQSDNPPTPIAAVKASSAKENAPTKDVATGFPSKPYSPVVGDVVEFEYYWEGECIKDDCKGLILDLEGPGELCVVSQFEHKSWEYNPANGVDAQKKMRKIGHMLKSPVKAVTIEEGRSIAKAYFATPQFTGSYKVGDRVKVVDSGDCGHKVGSIGTVSDNSGQNSLGIKHDGIVRWHNAKNLEPVK